MVANIPSRSDSRDKLQSMHTTSDLEKNLSILVQELQTGGLRDIFHARSILFGILSVLKTFNFASVKFSLPNTTACCLKPRLSLLIDLHSLPGF